MILQFAHKITVYKKHVFCYNRNKEKNGGFSDVTAELKIDCELSYKSEDIN